LSIELPFGGKPALVKLRLKAIEVSWRNMVSCLTRYGRLKYQILKAKWCEDRFPIASLIRQEPVLLLLSMLVDSSNVVVNLMGIV